MSDQRWQGFAGDLGPERVDGARRPRGGHLDDIPGPHPQAPERRLRQARLPRSDHRGIVADHRRREQALAPGAHLDLTHAGQPLGAQARAVAGQDDHVFTEGVQGQRPGDQPMRRPHRNARGHAVGGEGAGLDRCYIVHAVPLHREIIALRDFDQSAMAAAVVFLGSGALP
jgi:hypothetical protein